MLSIGAAAYTADKVLVQELGLLILNGSGRYEINVARRA
jgi:hypothetical protein